MTTKLVVTLALTLVIVFCAKGYFFSTVSSSNNVATQKSDNFEFALIGDNPYFQKDIPKFERLIDDINSQSNIEWVIHLGDAIGSEWGPSDESPCSDENFKITLQRLQNINAPYILTPGDNDWLDCSMNSPNGVGGLDPLDRLAFLRELFFKKQQFNSEISSLKIERQSASSEHEIFIENALWQHNGIVFSTIHLLGFYKNNPDDIDEFREQLVQAAIAWLDKTFDKAREIDASGVFISTHADLWPVSGHPIILKIIKSCKTCLDPRIGLEKFYPALALAASKFKKPVAMAVGDSHIFRVDNPLKHTKTSQIVENFTRVGVFGMPQIHWVKVKVNPNSREVFSFHQEIIPENMTQN